MVAVRSINCEFVFLKLTKTDAAFIDLAAHKNELDFDTVVPALHAPDCGQSLSSDVRKRRLSVRARGLGEVVLQSRISVVLFRCSRT